MRGEKGKERDETLYKEHGQCEGKTFARMVESSRNKIPKIKAHKAKRDVSSVEREECEGEVLSRNECQDAIGERVNKLNQSESYHCDGKARGHR